MPRHEPAEDGFGWERRECMLATKFESYRIHEVDTASLPARDVVANPERFDDLGRYGEVLRAKSGRVVNVRFVEPRDREKLQSYVRSLSVQSRRNRFLGAMSELPEMVLDRFIHVGENDQFMVVATTMVADGSETIIGEGCYAFHADTSSAEIGLSIDDRWQGRSIGRALLKDIERRVTSIGAEYIFGDTLRFNGTMIGLARDCGYTRASNPLDWRLVRLKKEIRIKSPETSSTG
jgi:GNAT superfamily N-acetyltransferase